MGIVLFSFAYILRYQNSIISLNDYSNEPLGGRDIRKRGEQARLARAKRESALPIGPLRGDISPLKYFTCQEYIISAKKVQVRRQEISRDSSPPSLYIDFGLFLLVFSFRERRETRRSAPQTTRLSSSSTRRLVKVADIRLLRGKSLDIRINPLIISWRIKAIEYR